MPKVFRNKVKDDTPLPAGVQTPAAFSEFAISTNRRGLILPTSSITAGEQIKRYIAGERLEKREAVFREGSAQTLDFGGATNNETNGEEFGRASQDSEEVSQSFIGINGALTSILIRLKKSGSPTDNIVIEIHKDSQTGDLLATASIDGSTLTTSYADYTVSFDKVELDEDVTYYITYERDSTLDDSNYYLAARGNAGAVSGEVATSLPGDFDGASWTNGAVASSQPITIKLLTEVGKVYKTKGGTAATEDGFIGFVDTDVVHINVEGNFRISGVVKNFSGLTQGGQYRCDSSTRGAIVNSGTDRVVGIAPSDTEILITNNFA